MSKKEYEKKLKNLYLRLMKIPEENTNIEFFSVSDANFKEHEKFLNDTPDLFSLKEEKILAKIDQLKDLLAAGVAIPQSNGAIHYTQIMEDSVYRQQLQDYIMGLTKKFLNIK